MVTREDAPFICSPCFTMCNSKKSYDQHCSGKLHIKKCKETNSSRSIAETSKTVPGTLSCSVCNLKYENLNDFIEHCYSIEHASNILKKVKVQNCEGEPSHSSHCTSREEKEETFSSCDQASTGVNQISTPEDNSGMDHVEPESKVVSPHGTDVLQENSAVQPCHAMSANVDDVDQNKDIHYCTVCDVPVMGLRNYKEHLKGSKHQKQKTKQTEIKSSDVEKGNLSDDHPKFQMNNNHMKYQSSFHHVNGRQRQIRANQAKHVCCGKQSCFAASVDHYRDVHPNGSTSTALSTIQTNCNCYPSHMGVSHMNLMKSPVQVSRCQEIDKHPVHCLGTSQPNLGNPSDQMNGPFFCSTCSVPCNSRKSLEQHCRGKAHKKKCEEIQGFSYSSNTLVGTKATVPKLHSCR